MTNSIFRFYQNSLNHPQKMAIADIKTGVQTFEDIRFIGAQTQKIITDKGITTGDAVLVAIPPSPTLYGALTGLIGLGVKIIVIEPWLSLSRIDHIIETVKPKAFLTSTIGKIWGIRSKKIRSIKHWITPADILKQSAIDFQVVELPDDHPAFIVFSSGTTGLPKGVLRTHGYLERIYKVLTELEPQHFDSPDLILFPSVALFHLGTGRGSVLVPRKFSEVNLEKLLRLCREYKPQTLSSSPFFLKTLIDRNILGEFNFLDRIVVGGALCDCDIMKKAFAILPDKKFIHIYGSSEAEPVSTIDARLAVELSEKRGFFQNLCVGEIIPHLKTKDRDGILWVNGPNVAGEYIGDPSLNKGIKERDEFGELWHCMGDRIIIEDNIGWFSGRESQRHSDFILEQKVYSYLAHSKCFIHRIDEKIFLVGEKVKERSHELKSAFPEIHEFINSKINRDKRHHSRIDRLHSLPKKMRKK